MALRGEPMDFIHMPIDIAPKKGETSASREASTKEALEFLRAEWRSSRELRESEDSKTAASSAVM